ncbi:hypothetical protein D187_007436 [Cystobacter fuscus DSM 2262]|uniref:Uncharacterized protein n=1 Tax=Cystobacter fuscus (strain ATCC 25194 / DSM 2262 / NBRC 100088 / M29) TaxID=1242864 RepID=S9Q466_CYSF2|nr:hypothetical protein [Cystobacter fuscus]EPX56094.1 hypothetical protein D187_007436 [Cystobacter fuscus DSM 2262]
MARMNLMGWALLLALAGAAVSEAKPVKYAGPHPRTGQPDGGLCHIQAVHVHAASPVHAPVLYRQHGDVYFFIGDPTPFGYDGPRHSYYGHHPVVINVVLGEDSREDDVAYCYHDGPHSHYYPPPPRHDFEEQEDVYYYTDEYPEAYTRDRPRLVQVNIIYRPWHYARPVVTRPPPRGYHGPVVQVNVNVPAVGIEVNVNPAPVHYHEHDRPRHMKHKHKHKHKKFKDRD